MSQVIYTPTIQKAIKFATKTHNQYQQQLRKGKVIPYITHPLTAGIILALANAPEEVIVAGILHDTIEDSLETKKVTPQMIEERFGKKVKDLVVSVTEEKNLSRHERKALAIEHIKHFSRGSVLVKSADVLSNGTELLDDYQKVGKEVFKRFKATPSETIINYKRAIEALIKRWPMSPLAKDLKNLDKGIRLLTNLM
jgi:guanosine-3',5'-bis(diphosphate) 3'-pyrophosphohydrolase